MMFNYYNVDNVVMKSYNYNKWDNDIIIIIIIIIFSLSLYPFFFNFSRFFFIKFNIIKIFKFLFPNTLQSLSISILQFQ